MSDELTVRLRPYQNKGYKNPFPFRQKAKRAAWVFVWHTLFRPTPRVGFSWWRRALLMLFGGEIGWPVYIHPTVQIWAPWNLQCGSGVALSDRVELYAVDKISIGNCVAISQGAFICTASHDIRSESMDLIHSPVKLHDYAWIAARAFIGPGVTVGEGGVVGACSVVVRDVPSWTVVAGNPARGIGPRTVERRPVDPFSLNDP